MKKVFLCIISLLVLFGCTMKEETPIDDSNQEEPNQEDIEQRNEDDNYTQLDFTSLEVERNVVVLNYSFNTFPIGVEHALLVYQNGVPVPFSFDKDGPYAKSQRFTYQNEKNEERVYVHANSFQKGDKLDFGMGLIANPDYIPEVIDFTRYDILKQNPLMASKSFEVKESYENKEQQYQVFDNVVWQELGEAKYSNNIADISENDDVEVLKAVIANTAVNDLKTIHTRKGESVNINVMAKQQSMYDGYVTFYIDHKAVSINGGFDAAVCHYEGNGFGVANFDLEIPNDIASGNHTFYAVVSYKDQESKFSMYFVTKQRVLIVE